jgi:hypothetical protein
VVRSQLVDDEPHDLLQQGQLDTDHACADVTPSQFTRSSGAADALNRGSRHWCLLAIGMLQINSLSMACMVAEMQTLQPCTSTGHR